MAANKAYFTTRRVRVYVRACVCVSSTSLTCPISSPPAHLPSERQHARPEAPPTSPPLRTFSAIFKPPSSLILVKGRKGKGNKQKKSSEMEVRLEWKLLGGFLCTLIERKSRCRNWRRLVERRQSTVPSFGKGERSSPHDALLDLCDLKQESRFFKKTQNLLWKPSCSCKSFPDPNRSVRTAGRLWWIF